MWAGTGLSLSAGSFAAALPSWRSVVGGLPLGLAAAIEKRRADGGEGSFHACEVLFARNRVCERANFLRRAVRVRLRACGLLPVHVRSHPHRSPVRVCGRRYIR